MRITNKALTILDVVCVVLTALFIILSFLEQNPTFAIAGVITFAASLGIDAWKLHRMWGKQL